MMLLDMAGEWEGCTEVRPFHGVREVQSHLRARHFGGGAKHRKGQVHADAEIELEDQAKDQVFSFYSV